jgi:hypothetical protein
MQYPSIAAAASLAAAIMQHGSVIAGGRKGGQQAGMVEGLRLVVGRDMGVMVQLD